MQNGTFDEAAFYQARLGYDPYSIWITSLKGLTVVRTPARLLAYANDDHTLASIRYLDGGIDIVKSTQMARRQMKTILEL